MSKPTRKWWRMADIYLHFAGPGNWDKSEQAAQEMFDYESTGGKIPDARNAFLVGKQWMDLTITEYWLPDLAEGKILFKEELYADENLPD